MSLRKDYLELVQLSSLYLLQKLPSCSAALPKISLESPKPKPQPVVEAAAHTEKKESPLPPPTPPPAPIAEPKGLESMRELMKTHCSHLKLTTHPLQNLADALILYDRESAEEKELLHRIGAALQNQGFTCLIMPVRYCPQNIFHPQFLKAVIAEKALVEAYPHCKTDFCAIIPDLQLFLREPQRRIEWWQNLMNLCRR